MMTVVMLSLSRSVLGDLIEAGFAVPLRKPSKTVDAMMRFTINKRDKTCTLNTIDGVLVNQTFDRDPKFFQILRVSPCVFFKCKKKGVDISFKKSACHYGESCVKKVPSKEGSQYSCVVHLEELKKSKTKEGGKSVSLDITYQLLNGFVATEPVTFSSQFDKKTRTCTMGEQTMLLGESVSIEGLDNCAVVKCTKKGLAYQPTESACSVKDEVCKTIHERGCTKFKCARATLNSKAKRGKATSTVLNSWMKLNEPSCKFKEVCLSLTEMAAVSDNASCSNLVCLEKFPGLPEILPSQTGCVAELLGDKCVTVGEKAGNLVPAGPVDDLDDVTCVEYVCKQTNTDPFRPVVASLFPAEFGCRDEKLAGSLSDENEEPFGCFREGIITERNCTRLMCKVTHEQGSITKKNLIGRCVDETGGCRNPKEKWKTADGRLCTCKLGGGEPECILPS